MKNIKISFAHFICLAIIFPMFIIEGYAVIMSYSHSVTPDFVNSVIADLKPFFSMAVIYCIGTSYTSAKKDDVISTLMNGQGNTTPPPVTPPVAEIKQQKTTDPVKETVPAVKTLEQKNRFFKGGFNG